MLSVLCREKEGFAFYFELKDGAETSGGGLTDAGELVCCPACTQKELLLRALVNKCMNDFVPLIKTRDVWGTDLSRFGFVKDGAVFVSSWDRLKLPHGCERI